MKRTLLPLNGLRVLDAAARHLSFTRAADELAVTPAAVGQQIRALEDMLGVVLFRRTPKGLETTPECEAGLDALRQGFLMLEDTVRAMQAGQSSSALTIAAPRDLTAKWLAPRLARYRADHPDVRFNLIPADDMLDFTDANLDLAIRLTDGPGEHQGVALAPGEWVRVAAPGASAETPIAWGKLAGPAPTDGAQATIRLGDAGLAIDAAASGLGAALVPAMLAAADLAANRVRALGEPVTHDATYWLIAPMPQWRQKKVRSIVAALTDTTGEN